ncbi:low molecular weight protein-tyrosine-phosphatase [Nocardioides aurantiacus]|uniref:protein-tyrosine-phosphatase n=1 Tax=Nocardioides aurantiacus TaxID=86796 RepID=A0A3N2CZX5_9ACTN|nr:low molecular weight protein-tyrosine-phosphatase [Nocardioides aurantiacus]ROR92754.1 protein-tyrosine phosphatase [Nocardioides aurantiacus]
MAAPALPAPLGAPYRIGFVCLGNICRSPMADVVTTSLVADAGLADRVEVRSSGTGGWHVGQPMDERAAARLTASGYDASRHRAQQHDATWAGLDLVLAMDAANLAEIGGESDRVRLFRSFDPEADADPAPDVPDPYYGGDAGFADVLAMVERTCAVLVDGLARLDLR